MPPAALEAGATAGGSAAAVQEVGAAAAGCWCGSSCWSSPPPPPLLLRPKRAAWYPLPSTSSGVSYCDAPAEVAGLSRGPLEFKLELEEDGARTEKEEEDGGIMAVECSVEADDEGVGDTLKLKTSPSPPNPPPKPPAAPASERAVAAARLPALACLAPPPTKLGWYPPPPPPPPSSASIILLLSIRQDPVRVVCSGRSCSFSLLSCFSTVGQHTYLCAWVFTSKPTYYIFINGFLSVSMWRPTDVGRKRHFSRKRRREGQELPH